MPILASLDKHFYLIILKFKGTQEFSHFGYTVLTQDPAAKIKQVSRFFLKKCCPVIESQKTMKYSVMCHKLLDS